MSRCSIWPGLVCAFYVLACARGMVRYSGYKVYRFTPTTDAHVEILRQLEAAGVDFWTGPTKIGGTSDLMFAPHQQADLLNAALTSGMDQRVYISDVQTLMNEDKVGKTTTTGEIDWTNYYKLDDIYAYLAKIEAENPYVQIINFGQSFECRDLKVVKISKFCETGENKPIVFIEANTHSREWISNAVATFIINELISGPLQQRLDDFDFHIVPMGNPDGYEFTHTGDRLWRKTRSVSANSSCFGADTNRNWDYHWMQVGGSQDPCSDVYAGATAFSEVEIRLLAKYYESIADNVVFFFAMHSYSEMILYPWGDTHDQIPDYDRYKAICKKAVAALHAVNGTEFYCASIAEFLSIHLSSGSSADWVYAKYPKTKLVMGTELRGSDHGHGFLLPPELIIPSARELIAALQVLMDHVKT